MKKDLFLRTDVLPAELPILFSNKAVYLGFSKKNFDSERFLDVVTVPYYYFIPKSNKETRKMGLVHPIAQLQMFQYILKYENLVTSFCGNSQYSVRAPIKRNIPKISEQELRAKEILKLEEEFSLVDKISVTSEEDKILFYNYFSYRRYTRIKDLYSSPKFNRDKYKYKFFLKLDIQQFFPSIYTHSLSWALFGDKSIAKKYKGSQYKSAFPNASDIIAQKINFNETHGLIIGPEFSRVIAELLLTRVDIDLHARLREGNLYNKKNYSIYRYVDDYFLFASKKEDILYIEECLKRELNKYNLSLNVHKSMLQEKPFRVSGGPILKLKIILREFKQDKKLAFDLKKEKESGKLLLFSEYKGSINQWNNLFNRVEDLIIENYDSQTKIINYFLKAIRSLIIYDGNHNHIIANILELVSNIFILDPNNNSTNYLIAIYIKLLNKAREYRDNLELVSSETGYQKRIENIVFIEEKIFQNAFRILKVNFESIEQMYDLIIFMKSLEKKLSSNFLCEILSSYGKSYFVCCAVAYYILDEDQKCLNLKYKTVAHKLLKIIDKAINEYEPKGSADNLLEGEYFYFLNDFSKYPGFFPSKRKKLTSKLISEYKHLCNRGKMDMQVLDWEKITKNSYFEWESNKTKFERRIIKKSSNTRINSKANY